MQTEFQAWYELLLEDAEEAAVHQRGRGATATGRLAPHSSGQSVSSARGGGGGGGGGGRGGGEVANVRRRVFLHRLANESTAYTANACSAETL